MGEAGSSAGVIRDLLGGGFPAEPGGLAALPTEVAFLRMEQMCPAAQAQLGTGAGRRVMVCVPGVHVCSPRWATSGLALTLKRMWDSPEERKQVGAHSRGSGPPPRWRGLSSHTHARSRVARARSLPTGWEQRRGQQRARPQGEARGQGAMGQG